MLCVTAVLLLLIALSFPMLDAARDRGITTSCLSQERQLWTGLNLYCSDNQGAFVCWDEYQTPDPVAWYWYKRSNQTPWIDLSMRARNVYMAPYVGIKVWHDPGGPDEAPTGYGISAIMGRSSGNSSWKFAKGITTYQGFGPVRLTEIPYPSTTALLACKLPGGTPNLYVGGGGYCALVLCQDESGQEAWPLHGPWFQPGIKTKSNVVRIDGSARTYETRDLLVNPCPYSPGPYGPPYWASAGRAYLWSGWRPLDAASPEQSGWLGE
jgi:hypothetical protein